MVNRKSVFVTGLVLLVAYYLMAFFVHGLWLGSTYSSLAGEVWRPQAELFAKSWIVHSTTIVFCFVFAYLFARGYRDGGWREGAWFGFVAHLFVGFQAVFHAYATYPIPFDLTLKWYFAGLGMSLILGVLASRVYKPSALVGMP